MPSFRNRWRRSGVTPGRLRPGNHENHVFSLIYKQNQWFSIVSFLVVQFADLGGPVQCAELKPHPNMVPPSKNIIYDDINRLRKVISNKIFMLGT